MGISIKTSIISILDKIAPLKKVSIQEENKFPWFDLELYKVRHLRNVLYEKANKTQLQSDWGSYKTARNNFAKLNKQKIITYFENKGIRDFKNSKKFWEFYKSSVKIRSDKSYTTYPLLILDGDRNVTDPDEISTLFNNFFTSLESTSLASSNDCDIFIKEYFNNLKRENKLLTPQDGFSFKHLSTTDV